MRICAITGFLLLLWPPCLQAEPEVQVSTDMLIEKAADLYSEMNYEKTIKVLDRVLGMKGNTRAQLVRAYHIQGMCLASLGRNDDAKKSFAKLLALEPSFRLGNEIAPRIRTPFNQLVVNDRPRLSVRLLPPPVAVKGDPLLFTIHVDEDTTGLVRSSKIWVRPAGEGSYSSVNTKLRGVGEVRILVPATTWESKESVGVVGWYAEVMGKNEGKLRTFGDALHPMALEISEEKIETLLERAEEVAWYKRWWVWALVGGVVTTAGVVTAVVLTKPWDSSDYHDVWVYPPQ
jgi:hypothetical protein